jgi:predicted heme/steroid binding protein/uncharacterized membrane protein
MKPALVLSLFFLSLIAAFPVAATEEYARQTDQACSICHLDPAGGGELTGAGLEFQRERAVAAGPVQRIVRLVVGYLHHLTAIFWFGTIFYVHLVLKPAYASAGLPRGEVRVGLASMAVMAVTGAILTAFRIGSFDALLGTRFGILLLVKIGLFLIMVGSALLAVLVIGPRLKRAAQNTQAGAEGALDPGALARCDGQEGRPTWFAYQGRIFDASGSKLWQGGRHMGRHPAGRDLTEALAQAPHGADQIQRLPELGRLAQAPAGAPAASPQKLFFLMAHLNLGLALAIILVLALWRWW